MLQITVISMSGSRYPIGWFAKEREADALAYADEMRRKWTSVLVHEIDCAILCGVLIDRTHWEIKEVQS